MRWVVGVGEHFVAKYGPAVKLIGETMLFIRQATSVPVPKIYALFQDHKIRKAYIVMERILRKCLDSEWDSLGRAERGIDIHKLRLQRTLLYFNSGLTDVLIYETGWL